MEKAILNILKRDSVFDIFYILWMTVKLRTNLRFLFSMNESLNVICNKFPLSYFVSVLNFIQKTQSF